VRYMMDTDSVSYLLKGVAPQVEARLEQLLPSEVSISVMTRAEIGYGLRRLPASHPLHVVCAEFLSIVPTLAWDSPATDWYAEIRHQLLSSGQSIGEIDMMIAAHALSVRAVLVTNNLRHFRRIDAPLQLENWIDTETT